MMIKIMPYRSAENHRICDIARHIRYLLNGRNPDATGILNRLAGPPHCVGLIQRIFPYDESYRAAASDVATQIFDITQRASFGRCMPRQIYSHIVISFAPRYRARNPLPSLSSPGMVNISGTYSGSCQIAMDTLIQLGIEERNPLYLVVHCDKRHLHAHVLVCLYSPFGDASFVTNLNQSFVRKVAHQTEVKFNLIAEK